MILKVPYYSQTNDTKNPQWKDQSCGIAALKMVLDFYQSTNLTIDELYQKGLEIEGFLEGVGWYHHSLALLAKSFGLKAITRSWNIPEESLKHLKERGFTKEDIDIMNQQQLEEGSFILKSEITKNHPVIVSLPKGFNKGGSGHLVVLIGYDENQFYFNDPVNEKRAGQSVALDYKKFKKIWPKRAVIIYPD